MRGEEIASKCDRKAQGDGTSDQKLCRIYDAICLETRIAAATGSPWSEDQAESSLPVSTGTNSQLSLTSWLPWPWERTHEIVSL
jgi:hypothetical protein